MLPADNSAPTPEELELYHQCVLHVIAKQKAGTAMLQRIFRIGYGRAAKIMNEMETNGIVRRDAKTGRYTVLISQPQP